MFSQWYVANEQTKKSFSVCFRSCSFGLFCAFESVAFDEQERQQADTDDAPKKGQYRRKTAGNSSLPNTTIGLFDHYPIVNSRQGSHGPLQTRPSIQAQSKDTSPSATVNDWFNNSRPNLSVKIFNSSLLNFINNLFLK
jgi:hypothetical protein